MVFSDAVKITIVVVAPVLFFTVLFAAAYLYRRYHSPYRHGTFRVEDGIWDPSKPEGLLPHCHMCYQNHSHGQDIDVSVEDGPSYESKAEGANNISELHYVEKSIDVRRLNHNPYAPDLITRVNSISSTLASKEPANTSSDVLPFGGGRRASHASAVDPNRLGYQGVEANALSHGVIAVGDRRPSVLSGGLSDRRESDTLSVRKVSFGGGEEMVNVQAAGIDQSKLPVRRSSNPSRSFSRRPSIKDGELQHDEQLEPVPFSHPFSATSLSSSTSLTRGGVGSASIVPPVPALQQPPPPRKNIQNRPGSLKLTSTSTRQSSHPPPSILASAYDPVTGVSTKALKSALITSPEMDEMSTGSDISEDFVEPTPGVFEAWKGFPQQGSPARAVLIQPLELTHASGQEPPAEPSLGPTSPKTLPPTPAPRPSQLIPASPKPSAPPIGLALPSSGVERRSSSSSNRSITYLADVVRDKAQRKGAMSAGLPGKERKNSLHVRAEEDGMEEVTINSPPPVPALVAIHQAQSLSSPTTPLKALVSASLSVPSPNVAIGRKASTHSAKSNTHLVVEMVRENSVRRKSATVVPASPAETRPQSVHVEIVSPNVYGEQDAPMLSPSKFQENLVEYENDSSRGQAI
ncbi:hypothetical protein L198_02439 [Cryptococcus wingfieldii CBS 7118]|uniref:Uncharacterized protein n=1 Tax=Cryptococcus wingfieldii CBS 7118 TaxID=1295528 RepID=A0A1E3JRV0_9TREE|nr:hypothetical protein L198_02439 [Cryptococcus wingfieldii CBS 7118]ODO03590.1 hypothetical protein L198_02439 [Cryptococcus wingfieldii CBS 7118]